MPLLLTVPVEQTSERSSAQDIGPADTRPVRVALTIGSGFRREMLSLIGHYLGEPIDAV